MATDNTKSPVTLLTVGEVAELLKVSARTVRRLIEKRELPVIRCGGVVRIANKDFERFIAARRFD